MLRDISPLNISKVLKPYLVSAPPRVRRAVRPASPTCEHTRLLWTPRTANFSSFFGTPSYRDGGVGGSGWARSAACCSVALCSRGHLRPSAGPRGCHVLSVHWRRHRPGVASCVVVVASGAMWCWISGPCLRAGPRAAATRRGAGLRDAAEPSSTRRHSPLRLCCSSDRHGRDSVVLSITRGCVLSSP
jgi:hypothetical protein